MGPAVAGAGRQAVTQASTQSSYAWIHLFSAHVAARTHCPFAALEAGRPEVHRRPSWARTRGAVCASASCVCPMRGHVQARRHTRNACNKCNGGYTLFKKVSLDYAYTCIFKNALEVCLWTLPPTPNSRAPRSCKLHHVFGWTSEDMQIHIFSETIIRRHDKTKTNPTQTVDKQKTKLGTPSGVHSL